MLFLFSGLFSYWNIKKNAEALQHLDQESEIKQNLLSDIHFYIGYGHGIHHFKNLVMRRDLSKLEPALKDFQAALEKIEEYAHLKSATKEEIEALGKINVMVRQYQANTLIVESMIKDGFTSAQIDARVKQDDEYELQAIEAMHKAVAHVFDQKRKSFDELARSALRNLAIAWILSMLISFCLVQLFSSNIFSSIRRITEDTEKIALGDLDHQINFSGAEELGALGNSLEKMRASLTETISNLEMSNKDLEQYAYVVSHDLQEPLRKILAFGSKIESSTKGKLDEESQFYLSRMLDSAGRMRILIDDLLSYARITKKSPSPEPVDLNKIVENVWADLELLAKEKGAKLKFKALPKVSADPIQMRQLFQNLIHNALKFSRPNETPLVEVSADVSEIPGFADFNVKDNGIGFAQKYADRIMIPFQRLHGRGEYSGTGIGLAVCNKIVTKHGGRLRAQSSPGEGSEFVFSLPIAEKFDSFEHVNQRVI